MTRAQLLYVAVVAAAACLVLEVATGLILWIAVTRRQGPHFHGGGANHSFLGVDRSTWIDLHDWVGLLLAAVIIVHLALNWRWVKAQTRLLQTPPPKSSKQ